MLDPAERRGPRPGLDTHLRRLGDHDPETADGTSRRVRDDPAAAPAARDPRPLRAGLGVQDRHGDRRPRVPRDHPRRPTRSSPAEKNGLVVDGFRIRDGHHPETGDDGLDLIGATEVSCNIWYALTGLQTGGEQLVGYADAARLRSPLPFDLPTARRRSRTAPDPLPVGSSTTSSWRTPPTARARRS
jgi:hypothetical protein